MTERSISETLCRIIHDSESEGVTLTKLAISQAAARQLSEECSRLELTRKTTAAEIYAAMEAGTVKFMDRQISVTK